MLFRPIIGRQARPNCSLGSTNVSVFPAFYLHSHERVYHLQLIDIPLQTPLMLETRPSLSDHSSHAAPVGPRTSCILDKTLHFPAAQIFHTVHVKSE